MIIICAKITSAIFNRKLFLAILCRKTIMPIKAPKLPPKKVKSNNINSEILLLCCLAKYLSRPKRKNISIVNIIKNIGMMILFVANILYHILLNSA